MTQAIDCHDLNCKMCRDIGCSQCVDCDYAWVDSGFMDLRYTKLPDDGNSCVRLRGANGNYLSLLPCGVDPETGRVTCVDLAAPDGKVVYCGVPNGLVDTIIEHLGLEKIDG